MVLLTVIAVATLLVAVVGATFAYFTATATTNPSDKAEATVTTNKLDGATITFTSEKQLQMLDYPGGLAVYGAKATIAKQDEGDNNEYQATFNLKITYTNKTQTPLDWTLYMVESSYDNLDATQTTTCKLRKKIVGNDLQLWYSDLEGDDPTNDAGCKGEAITTKLTNTLQAKTIASGKLLANKTDQVIDKNSTEDEEEYKKESGADLANRAINTDDKQDKYYYLAVKYPNQNANQSLTDEEKEIKVSLSIDGTANLSLYEAE